MTRRMGDAVTVANLPPGLDLYAAYLDGRYANYHQVCARFLTKTVIAIAVSAADNEGDCLDVEQGDATPAQAPGWVQRRRAAGHRGPLVYCSESAWPSVRAAFAAQGVPAPGYWVAGYPGAEGDAIPFGAIGHQWIDHNGLWDESIMVDHLPGIDPDPTTDTEGILDLMATDNAFAVRYLFLTFLCREPEAAGFATDVAYLNAGGTLNQLLTNLQDSPEGKVVLAARRKALGLPAQ